MNQPMATRSAYSIRCTDIRVVLGGKVVLDRLNLEVAPGETLGILGTSGSGKTTLLNTLAGFVLPDRGEVTRARAGVVELARPDTHVGYVFQDFALFPGLSIRKNLLFGLDRLRLRRVQIEELITKVAGAFEISHLLDRDPETLSGGERQRVALARSFAPHPEFCLLDEPFSQLDLQLKARIRRRVHAILSDLGSTNVVVSHDFSDCAALCTRIGIIDHGSVLQIGSPIEVYRRPVSLSAGLLTGGLVAFARSGGDELVPIEIGRTDGEAVSLACRPENVRLGEPQSNTELATEGFGRITDVSYLGSTVELQVKPRSGAPFVVAVWSDSADAVRSVDSEVHYYVPRSDAIQF